ncbi:hypothetical protein CQ018_11855 [Arthrobacter sp. MYb227]|nr:hypothetical protein CQ018_11855 [Arthrobacter sp. MYb227]
MFSRRFDRVFQKFTSVIVGTLDCFGFWFLNIQGFWVGEAWCPRMPNGVQLNLMMNLRTFWIHK